MTSKKITDLAHFKNLVRGAFAHLHNRVPHKSSRLALTRERAATSALKQALTAARRRLSAQDLMIFEKWVDEQQKALHLKDEIGTSRSVLGLVPKSIGRRGLSEVLKLTCDSLLRAKTPLVEFKGKLIEINSLLVEAQYEKALAAIKSVTEKWGYSFWAVEAEIAVLNSMGRQGEAKKYIKALSEGAAGLNAFYLYYFGLRNESSQSAFRLRSIISRKINDSDLELEYRAYAAYRAARIVPQTQAEWGGILSYEQLTTKIDLLLTAERFAVEAIGNPTNFEEVHVKVAEKILGVTAIGPPMNDGATLLPSVPLRTAIDYGVEAAIDGEQVGEAPQMADALMLGIAASVSFSGNETNEEALRKLAMNYWWLNDVIVLDSAGQLPRLPEIYAGHCSIQKNNPHPIIQQIALRFRELQENTIALKQAPPVAHVPDEPPWGVGSHPALIDCIAVGSAWLAFEADFYDVAMRLTHFALRHNARLLASLPLERMFRGVGFDRIRSYGIGVDLCNSLHWYTQLNSERQIRTFKRFAIEELIENLGASGIVEAAKILLSGSASQSVKEFFLVNTCDLSVIELLVEIEGTRQALEVRAQLLRLAAEGSESVAQLMAEADGITERLKIDDVLGELDETKVSVDEEALLPLVAREIYADFERYKQLLPQSISSTSSLSDLIKSLRSQSPTAFQIPKSEADDLLLQMLKSVVDLFLEEPVYGLDAIIGRRVRHGTISSELRGTLEHMHLIGQRPRTGADYVVPSQVGDICNRFGPDAKRAANRAIGRFSLAIDTLVAQVRDEIFQTKEKGKHRPAFELPLSTTMFAVARDSAMTAPTVEQFARELFDAFWFLLSTYSEAHRSEVKRFLELSLREIFAKLLADLRGAKITDAQLLAAVQQASEELQRRAEVIAGWIRIPKIIQEGRVLSVGTIFDAAMAMCKARRPGFSPISEEDIDRSINLDAHGYPIVFDALCIALENIAQHSGVKQGNRVQTSIKLSADGRLLRFKIESDIARDAWSREKSQKIESIREEIKSRAFADRAKRTSGSGLAKLATIVQQRPQCRFEFGPVEGSHRFCLEFELTFISQEAMLTDCIVPAAVNGAG